MNDHMLRFWGNMHGTPGWQPGHGDGHTENVWAR